MDAFEILVIIFSITLAIFLVLSIVLISVLIKIFKRVDSITEKAENFAENMQEAGEFFKKSARPVAAGKMIGNFIEWARSNNDSEGRKK